MRLNARHEFHVPTGAVDFFRLVVAVDHLLDVQDVAGLQLVEWQQHGRRHFGVALELELAEPESLALIDRDFERGIPRLAVLRVAHGLHLRLTDVGLNVPTLAIEIDDVLRVFFELVFLIHTAAGEDPEAAALVVFHLALELPVAEHLVAHEVDSRNLDLRTFGHLELQRHGLRAARDWLVHRLDLRVLKAFLDHHLADDVGDAFLGGLIDERIEPDGDAELAKSFLDLRLLDFFGAFVIDGVLDALALLHLVEDDLADDPVRERIVNGLDREIGQEIGGPERFEILREHLLDGGVVRLPLVLGGQADVVLPLDVIQVGLRLDERHIPLLFEAEDDVVHDRSGTRRRIVHRGADRKSPVAEGNRRPGRRRARRRRRRGDRRLRKGRPGTQRHKGATQKKCVFPHGEDLRPGPALAPVDCFRRAMPDGGLQQPPRLPGRPESPLRGRPRYRRP